jgi:hypothetical protein
MTWSPALTLAMTAAAIAPAPLPNIRQSSAPSSAATFLRRISTVGLLPRVYVVRRNSSRNPSRNAATVGNAKIELW